MFARIMEEQPTLKCVYQDHDRRECLLAGSEEIVAVDVQPDTYIFFRISQDWIKLLTKLEFSEDRIKIF